MAKQNQGRRNSRIGIPNIPAQALPWYLTVFTAITAYLAVSNTLFVVAAEKIVGWQGIQYAATGEILKAGGVALIASPIIVEAGRMVIAAIWSDRRERKAREEGHAVGLEEGHAVGIAEGHAVGIAEGHAVGLEEGHAVGIAEGEQRLHLRWEAWLQRQQEALANGIPFDEPPPKPEDQR